METIISGLKSGNIPCHVAIIMDGNGRWAQRQGLERSAGHVRGVDTVRQITEIASQLGVGYLTLYAFSTENWNRPQREVDILMDLIVTAIERETPDLIKNNVRLALIGDTSRMPGFAVERLNRCIQDTSGSTGLTLCLAISYSSRWELTEAVRQIASEVREGTLNPDQIDAETITAHLATRNMPDPDLLIRTGGDMRVSNFLLWQIAYSEIYVTDTFWPDFSQLDFCNAVAHFQKRERRFGLTGEQVRKS
ncbi:MAG: isoprenyl transferase [Muribaculaceae bacterium]|nr:isoprenyl transferase [Muribaculaceae bacterium]